MYKSDPVVLGLSGHEPSAGTRLRRALRGRVLLNQTRVLALMSIKLSIDGIKVRRPHI